MMIEQSIRERGIEVILYKKLEKIKLESRKEIIPFSLVFHRMCSGFSITKKECWELLYHLKEHGIIEIVPFHGIKVSSKILLE
jgi:hypothetical protein